MTRPIAARLLAMAAVVAMTAGCGARVAPGPPPLLADRSPAASVTDAGPTAAGTSEPESTPSAAPQGAATATSSPTPAPDFGPRHDNGVVEISLSATCVSPGDLLVVTLTTPPNAGLGMIIGYSDSRPHGAMNTGESDASGSYVWRVPVAPTVPEGTARVLVTSTGANWEGEGGTANADFTVARGGCA